MILNSKGLNNYFNFSKHNHWVVNCPDLSQEHRDELDRTSNISIGNDNLNAIGFLQNESRNPRIASTRKNLDPQKLYLDSTSSFHQVFTKEHLDNL